jgi:hypothetical protein
MFPAFHVAPGKAPDGVAGERFILEFASDVFTGVVVPDYVFHRCLNLIPKYSARTPPDNRFITPAVGPSTFTDLIRYSWQSRQ